MIRASEGSRPSQVLKEYVPEYLQLLPPNIPLGMTSSESAMQFAHARRNAAEKRLLKKYKSTQRMEKRLNPTVSSPTTQYSRPLSPSTTSKEAPNNCLQASYDQDLLLLDSQKQSDYAYVKEYYDKVMLADSFVEQLNGLLSPDVRSSFLSAAEGSTFDDDF